jgi:hypothetical protein
MAAVYFIWNGDHHILWKCDSFEFLRTLGDEYKFDRIFKNIILSGSVYFKYHVTIIYFLKNIFIFLSNCLFED